jgi:hypothetical protein
MLAYFAKSQSRFPSAVRAFWPEPGEESARTANWYELLPPRVPSMRCTPHMEMQACVSLC